MQRIERLVVIFAAAVAVAGVGCISDSGAEDANRRQGGDAALGDASSPAIQSLEVEPETVSTSSTGMTDQYITVTIETTGFANGIDDVALSIRDPERAAPKNAERQMSVEGGTVTVENIQVTWFSGLGAGDYQIGATVMGPEGATVSGGGLATVTVTE
jgi:hypothetical protein